MVLLATIEFTVSGINLLGDQSPPPITLPALAVATPRVLLLEKTFYVCIGDNFCTSFRSTIGVFSSKFIIFLKSFCRIVIFVTFV